jgi:type VI protein secretion system component VasF
VLWLGHFDPLANWRKRAAAALERDGDQRLLVAAYLTVVPAVGIALPVALLYLGYRLYLSIWDADLFGRLLDLLRAIAAAIDPCMPGVF